MRYWQKLLVGWRNKNRTGLTVPFLIGSQINIMNQNSSIKDLLYEIAHGDLEIYLTYCPHINELILGIKEDGYGNFNGKFLKIHQEKDIYGKLYVSKIILNDTKESKIEEIIEILDNRYSNQIENSLFSKNQNNWTSFTEADIAFIRDNI